MEHDSAVASGVDTNIEALSLRPRGGGAPPPRPAASHEPPAAAATKQPGGEVGRIAEGEMSAAQSSAVAAGGEEQRSRGAASRAAGPNPAEDASEPEPALPTVRRMSSPDHLAPGKLGAQVVRHFPFEPDASPVEPAPASPARCGLGGADSCSPHVGTPPPPPAPQDSSPVTPLRARERSTQDVACQAPPQLPLPPNACCMLFVEGFPRDTDIRELRHVFRPLRGFQMLRVVELAEPGGAARPVAYVKFQDVACAAEAMRATQRYIWDLSDMRGPSLRVRYAVAVPSSTATPAGWAPPPSLRLDGVASIPHNAPASIPRSVQAAFPRRVERGAAAAHRTSTIERGEERTPTWWGQTAAADARGMGAKRAGSGDGRKWGLEPAPHETPPRTTALHAGHPRHSPAAQRDESRHGWAGSYATRGGAYEWRAPAAGYDVEGTHGSWEWWSAESMGTERRQAPYDAACADEPRRPAPRSARCAPRGSDSGDLHYVMHPHRERGIDRCVTDPNAWNGQTWVCHAESGTWAAGEECGACLALGGRGADGGSLGPSLRAHSAVLLTACVDCRQGNPARMGTDRADALRFGALTRAGAQV